MSEEKLLKLFLRQQQARQRRRFVLKSLYFSMLALVLFVPIIGISADYADISETFSQSNSSEEEKDGGFLGMNFTEKVSSIFGTSPSSKTEDQKNTVDSPSVENAEGEQTSTNQSTTAPVSDSSDSPAQSEQPAEEPEIDFGPLPDLSANHLYLQSLDIDTPIAFQINNIPAEVSAGLTRGVIQINGTALPGQRGNVYITGHSSNYSWVNSYYNNIFARLNEVKNGDFVFLNYKGTVYVYQVFDQSVVLPSDLSLFRPTEDSRLTLVTCWPVGTSLKRLVVYAKQISPNPKFNSEAKIPPNFQSLPS